MSSLSGKVIAITGAASGIGLAVAQHLASAGAKLSLTDASADGLESLANSISRQIGREHIFQRPVDVRDSGAVDEWMEETVQRFGTLDGAVNCAGVHPKESGSKAIWEVTDEDWRLAQDVNVSGTMYCVRAQLRVLVSAVAAHTKDTGSIVVFGSNSSVAGGRNLSAYTTSKHAVIGMMRSAAMDAAPYNIRVNAVCPGPIDTPMLRRAVPEDQLDGMAHSIPLKRLGKPEQITHLVSFLLGEESGFCTGGVYMADGGLTTG